MLASKLSRRGQKHATVGEADIEFSIVRDNPYDAETNPSGIISLGTADNFLMHAELTDFVNNKVVISDHTFGYGQGSRGSDRVRKAMADHLNRYFKPHTPILAEEVMFSSGVTAINDIVAWNLIDPGDGILLGMPIYGDFQGDLTARAGAELLFVPMQGVDPFSLAAIEKYEAILQKAKSRGIKARALWLCSPHNPLGQCYSSEVLKGYMRFCQKHRIHLISDEIYGLSVFDTGDSAATKFTSVLSIDPAEVINPDFLHVFYGMSKDFGAAGLRLGCLITRNQDLLQAVSAISRFSWPSHLSCEAAATMLEDVEWTSRLLHLNQQRLGENYRFTTKMLDDAGIQYHHGGNAGYFLWIDLSPYLPLATAENAGLMKQERVLAQRLMDAGIYLATGEKFASEDAGWFRVIFTHEKAKLHEGLRRMIATIQQAERGQ
ncbi:hypothetical protein MMC07_008306 [Pseudocyphellaria aurata]|nr:hypothetical protein [Pseudocyphellaria aurata]